ncbi:FAD-dependent oxidoreductase [Gilvimarinus sp. F26214L]|uniref:FAD-dependent oxidoreductase n=1 Tax=Gilvimarinus sp. DZF01 TaxID=3461371 RepID=UPI004045C9CF
MIQTPPSRTVELDIAIVGGGIAGLWLLNRLRGQGYQSALFEQGSLGSDQTLASQGMIHGGIKYTLAGALSKASESIADMPAYWSRCLAGEGNVDLQGAHLLSRHFYFWSSDGVSSRMSTFFASKAVQGRIEKLDRANYPPLLDNPAFKGQVYRLTDIVLDVPSVLQTLAERAGPRVFSLAGSEYQWHRDGRQAELWIQHGRESLRVRARRFVFTAGKGNADLLAALGQEKPRMQLRPVHQVWVKHNLDYDFFGHCLGPDTTPRISISTHPSADGRRVWSLGGGIAEAGVKQSEAEVIASAQREIRQLLPWVDLSGAEWLARRIDRAEARQRNFLRPDKAYAKPADGLENVIVGWPTKLTLAPNLANEVLHLLQRDHIEAGDDRAAELAVLPTAEVSLPPWDR